MYDINIIRISYEIQQYTAGESLDFVAEMEIPVQIDFTGSRIRTDARQLLAYYRSFAAQIKVTARDNDAFSNKLIYLGPCMRDTPRIDAVGTTGPYWADKRKCSKQKTEADTHSVIKYLNKSPVDTCCILRESN